MGLEASTMTLSNDALKEIYLVTFNVSDKAIYLLPCNEKLSRLNISFCIITIGEM